MTVFISQAVRESSVKMECIIYMYAIDWSVVVLCPDICHPLLVLTACWPPYQEHPGDHCRSRPRINQLNLVLTTTPGILYFTLLYLFYRVLSSLYCDVMQC